MTFTKKLSALILSSLVICLPERSAADASVESVVTGVLAEEGLVGAGWVLVTPARGVESGVAGYSDSVTRRPFDVPTRFHIGSVTKTLLATGVLRMATAGLLELDAPVSRYLPELPMTNPWRAETEVTLRHLLDHTSGIEDARMWQMFSERATPDTPLATAFPNPEKLLVVRTRPGSRFSYSNMGYGLLGLVIERVAGERYETWLDKNLLLPLGMSDSTFSFTTQTGPDADPSLAWGHIDDGSRYPATPVFLRPAGQFTTTATDLGRFAEFLMSDGSVDGETFIAARWMTGRGRATGTEAALSGLVAGYSLGLGRRDRHNVIGYCHSGNIVGFAAQLCVFPEEKKAFAWSVNTDSETADYGRITEVLVEALDLAPVAPPVSRGPADDIADWHGWYVPSPNRFDTFLYLDVLFGLTHVTGDGSVITLSPLQGGTRVLRSTGDYMFSAGDRLTTSHVFLRGPDGEYLLSDGFDTLEKKHPLPPAALWTSLVAGLAGLVWIVMTGIVVLVGRTPSFIRRPDAPAFLVALALFLPVPLFFLQSFMAFGDLTPASFLLAAVTAALPVGMLLTLIFCVRAKNRTRTMTATGIAAFFVLQWSIVLLAYGLIPLTLWR